MAEQSPAYSGRFRRTDAGLIGELKEPLRYETLRGRDIHNAQLISAANKVCVMELSDCTISGAKITWPDANPAINNGERIEWDVDELSERYYVDGYLIVQDTEDEGLYFLDCILKATPKMVLQRLTPCAPADDRHQFEGADFFDIGRKDVAVRRFDKRGDAWKVTDWHSYGTADKMELVEADYRDFGIEPLADSIPASQFWVFPWWRGVLEPISFLIQRIERCFLRGDQYTDPFNNALHIIGLLSETGEEDTNAATASKARWAGWPKGTELARLADATIPLALQSELEKILLPTYRDAAGIVKVSETAQLSGRSREIAMFRQVATVTKGQQRLAEFVAAFGGTSTFVPMDVGDTVEIADSSVEEEPPEMEAPIAEHESASQSTEAT